MKLAIEPETIPVSHTGQHQTVTGMAGSPSSFFSGQLFLLRSSSPALLHRKLQSPICCSFSRTNSRRHRKRPPSYPPRSVLLQSPSSRDLILLRVKLPPLSSDRSLLRFSSLSFSASSPFLSSFNLHRLLSLLRLRASLSPSLLRSLTQIHHIHSSSLDHDGSSGLLCSRTRRRSCGLEKPPQAMPGISTVAGIHKPERKTRLQTR